MKKAKYFTRKIVYKTNHTKFLMLLAWEALLSIAMTRCGRMKCLKE
jgi:hypothetical protein